MTPPAVIDQTIDEVIRLHDDFLDICMKECMLHNPQLLKILTKLMSTCIIFANHTERFTKTLTLDLEPPAARLSTSGVDGEAAETVRQQLHMREQRAQMASVHIAQVVADKNYLRTMRTFQENFDLSHRQLVETLNAYATMESEPHLSNLCSRLDFNDYYKR